MIDEQNTNPFFQTFYVSREISRSPLIADIIRINRRLIEEDLLKNAKIIISLRYGKRILINANYSDKNEINHKDIIEIIDYNPIKNIILAIGQKDPFIETTLHWLIHYARNDINAIIQLQGENILKKKLKDVTSTEKEFPIGTLDLIKEVLKSLRNSNKIMIKNIGPLFIGINSNEVENLVLKTYEESL
jgi:hypothetical protein